jgi:tRNA(fMet)-specific endonuclease VapC
MRGCADARENTEWLRAFLSGNIEVVRFDEDDAAVAGELRVRLEQEGAPLGPYDLMIAAQALRTHSILVTANTARPRIREPRPSARWLTSFMLR